MGEEKIMEATKEGKKKPESKEKKDDRKRKRQEKKQRKQEILEQIPKVNEDGISYTKKQIRRMVKRVEKGLPPVPTPQEEAELRKQEAELRKEEELELAGMLYNKEQEKAKTDNDSDNDDDSEEGEDTENKNEEEAEEEEDDSEAEEGDDKEQNENDKQDSESDEGGGEEEQEQDEFGRSVKRKKTQEKKQATLQPPNKKKRKLSKKPVPKDYVCQACQNKHSPPHWIYDCPDKVTVRGTNQVSASKKGNSTEAPSAKKVFVSGLFFDTKPTDVKAMFQSCGKVTSCKLLKFPDTGRCKGQAFIVFDTEESAKNSLKLNGTKISSDDRFDNNSGKKQKKSNQKQTPEKRELELRVTKVMNRAFTKAAKKSSQEN